MTIHFLYKTEKNWKNATVQISQERDYQQEIIRLSSGLTQEGMLARAKSVVMSEAQSWQVRRDVRSRSVLAPLQALSPIVQCLS